MKKVLLWCGLLLSTLVVGYFLYTTFFVISKEEKLKDSEARNSISVHSLDNVKALEMPVFEIFTEGNAPIVSKEEYINGKLTISNVDENLQLINEPLQIRGRGLSSWYLIEKKSYRIKFKSKNNLLGQGKEKARNWTLLAMHYDKSFLRNEAAYFFASKLNGISFVSSSSFIELWLNGEYQGVYEVCDQIEVNKGRIDINDSGEEEDIGYLVEINLFPEDEYNLIQTSNGETYEIKSNYVNSNQKKYIADYLSKCLKAIETTDKETIGNLIDIPSAVDCYIVEEF
ncbi:MAG: CotH kinase family protein, partial [Bacteroidaceae bacterium]|nr:CotH kinase family protein [Bacteroidaceae bacterium]